MASLVLPLACSGSPPLVSRVSKQRIVCLGDSITDGHTYLQLIRQALGDAAEPLPTLINAGVGGDTANAMHQRLKRDVFVHHPTLVTFSAGVNDALHKVSPADYEADVTAIADQLQQAHIPLLILTTTILGPQHTEAEARLADYDAILHRLAKGRGYPVAEVKKLMQEARSTGETILEDDGVHPNFRGQQLMARAVLDALGYGSVPVTIPLRFGVMPGVIRKWQIRAITANQPPLTIASVRNLKADATWKRFVLPEAKPVSTWWLDGERKRGFALSLDKLIGPGKSFQGIAYVTATKPHQVFFNTGAGLQTIWLNDQRIYKNQGWTGWHAGKERIPAALHAGLNQVIIETGANFFLSVTDTNTW